MRIGSILPCTYRPTSYCHRPSVPLLAFLSKDEMDTVEISPEARRRHAEEER